MPCVKHKTHYDLIEHTQIFGLHYTTFSSRYFWLLVLYRQLGQNLSWPHTHTQFYFMPIQGANLTKQWSQPHPSLLVWTRTLTAWQADRNTVVSWKYTSLRFKKRFSGWRHSPLQRKSISLSFINHERLLTLNSINYWSPRHRGPQRPQGHSLQHINCSRWTTTNTIFNLVRNIVTCLKNKAGVYCI